MFELLFKIGIIFVILFVIGNLWVRFIHPMLFNDHIEDRLDGAVEKKILKETDKKAAEILSDEAAEILSDEEEV